MIIRLTDKSLKPSVYNKYSRTIMTQNTTTDKTTNEKLLTETLQRLKKLEETVQILQQKLQEYKTEQPSPHQKEVQLFQPETTIEKPRRQKSLSPEAILEIDLMNLPDSQRKTMLVIVEQGEATPEEVADETNRTRGLENIYLNQLERLGYVEKTKKGKRVYFKSLRTT
ncbi:MAG: hypothetical protein QG670_1812 [Thermoproteota archaeon]|nr:hypothetical protein [Thermoproteota archaeon]